MPTNEKEYNGYLFDPLTILEDLQETAERWSNRNIKMERKKTQTSRTEIVSKTTINAGIKC